MNRTIYTEEEKVVLEGLRNSSNQAEPLEAVSNKVVRLYKKCHQDRSETDALWVLWRKLYDARPSWEQLS